MATANLLGYADRLSVRAGDRIHFMVSASGDEVWPAEPPRYRAEIVRLDRGPATPGELAPATPVGGAVPVLDLPGRIQAARPGSCVVVPPHYALQCHTGLTLQLWIKPTMLGRGGGHGIAVHEAEGSAAGWSLSLLGDGRLCFWAGQGAITNAPLPDRGSWFFVAATCDLGARQLRLRVRERRPPWLPAYAEDVQASGWGLLTPGDVPLLFGAGKLFDTPDVPRYAWSCFNGKLENPALWRRAFSDDELDALAAGTDPLDLPDGLVAAWDFSLGIGTATVHDRSPNRIDGEVLNGPMRGVTGHTWDGSATSFHANPEHYGAIAFHQDDLEDAGWEQDFAYDVPPDLPSGVYAARLTMGDEREEIPFYVRPAAGAPTAPILFLAPTNTYLAYANERLYTDPAVEHLLATITDAEIRSWGWQAALDAHPEIGASCYDRHPDRTGIAYSSRLRPIVTMRSDFTAFITSCPRHFSADLYLIEWLGRLGHPYDVATDEDLHLDGQALLAPYRVVLTGSHPEYWTGPMLDALEGYLAAGGRLMYLGGNGFYWVTAIDPSRPHLIEVRRTNAGTRSWESEYGEHHLSLSGEPGGLWRYRGRDPRRLTGVGFAAEGWCGASGYVRLPDSFRPEAAFIFDGVGEDETIGDFGLVMGGAAGDEVDRYDLALGTPPETLRLATSEGRHSDCYQLVVEDVTLMAPGLGGSTEPRVRADMTYLPLPNGGAVFAVGSINWCGSLPHNGFDNNVARMSENVLRRFADRDG